VTDQPSAPTTTPVLRSRRFDPAPDGTGTGSSATDTPELTVGAAVYVRASDALPSPLLKARVGNRADGWTVHRHQRAAKKGGCGMSAPSHRDDGYSPTRADFARNSKHPDRPPW
jgi:hypothetical protein